MAPTEKPPAQENLRAANRWIRANQGWLTVDHDPMVQQLRTLARTMDAEYIASGRVNAATAGHYRQAYQCLMSFKPIEQRRRDRIEAETDSLMSPGAWLGDDQA